MKTGFFDSLVEAPADIILGVAQAYRADTNPKKVDLGVGAYRTDEGIPYVFNVVRKVEKELANDEKAYKEYRPIDGDAVLKKASQKIIFGRECDNVCSLQSISGTGALRVGAEFIQTNVKTSGTILISKPTWAAHHQIFRKANFQIQEYRYWDAEKRCLDFDGFIEDMQSAPDGSVLLLHPVAHNPTGMDPTDEQWEKIYEVCIMKKFVPFLDSAYQGFASGDLDKDAKVIRMFLERGETEFFVAQSFAKNLGLYGERFGMLHIVCKNSERVGVVMSHVKLVVRPMYSSPPMHGAAIAGKILTCENNMKEWKTELAQVANRINKMRKALRDGLVAKKTPGTWDHITRQIGMFSFSGLTQKQSEKMTNHYHIYMLKNGRISLAGLNSSNIDYVIDAIDDCVRTA